MSPPDPTTPETAAPIEAGRREEWLAPELIELSDSLAGDFDVAAHLERLGRDCVRLLGDVEVAITLGDERGALHLVAGSGEAAQALCLYDVQRGEGPATDAFRTRRAIFNHRLGLREPWPSFGALAVAADIGLVQSVPMARHDRAIGALDVFHRSAPPIGDQDAAALQALADATTLAILQDRSLRQAKDLAEHLQHALDSRILIEQAKGVLAERLGVGVTDAFSLLRRYSQHQNAKVGDVSRRVVSGELSSGALVAGAIPDRRHRPPERLR